MRIHVLVVSLLAVAMFMIAGCGGEPEVMEKVPPLAEQAYPDVKLAVDPDPPVALKHTEMTATVTTPYGKPLTGASVVFDLSMPAMYHGENRPAATEVEPGVYKATGIMTMGGKWLISVEVSEGEVNLKRDFFTMVQGG